MKRGSVKGHVGLLEKAKNLLAKGRSKTEIARVLGISRPTLYRWLAEDRVKSEEVKSEELPMVKQEKTVEGTSDLKAIQQELAKVKQQLRQQAMLIELYDRMIDIAEQRFQIPIRKKHGAKQ